MDNGGASGDILDSVVRSGNQYLIRVKLNVSERKGLNRPLNLAVREGRRVLPEP